MRLKLEDLTKAVNTVKIVMGNNKIIPITQMIGLTAKDQTLVLSATNTFEYAYYKLKTNDDSKFDICVNGEIFTKLINKLTSPEVSIECTDKALVIRADGEYTLDILLDENTNATFPLKTIEESKAVDSVTAASFLNLKETSSAALATTLTYPSFIGYYVDDKQAIATDGYVMSSIDSHFFKEAAVLRSNFVDILSQGEGIVNLESTENNIKATLNNLEVYSTFNCPVADYPIDSIKEMFDKVNFNNTAKINKTALLSILDRIALFITPYDDEAIKLSFLGDKLYIKSAKDNGIEILPLTEVKGESNCEALIPINYLLNQLKSFKEDSLQIGFGNDTYISLSKGNVCKYMALMQSK